MVKAIHTGFLLLIRSIKKIMTKFSRKTEMSLIESIKKHEGYVGVVYKDSLGIDTIGYGFAIKDLELDEDICNEILVRKLKNLESMIKIKFNWFIYMPPKIQDVVMEMCYQLGVGGFSKFKKTIAYLQNKQFHDASQEMLDSLWAKQTPNRAKELSNRVKEVEVGH
jgi:lysozyme|tara:strand:- start:9 stop:506 length:498 start_codon:yes stop_codon:yes gene_type:complete